MTKVKLPKIIHVTKLSLEQHNLLRRLGVLVVYTNKKGIKS